MGMFKLTKEGAWYIYSKKDKRWCVNGTAMVGGFQMPQECEEALERLKKKYGKPPKDLEWGYEKY